MATNVTFTKSLAAANATLIAGSQTPGSAALTLTSNPVIVDTASATNIAIGRRVIVTSGGNDTGINWVVVGTNSSGSIITDTFAGVNAAAAQSNLDFATVISITPSGAVATTASAGTNGVGSSQWLTWNFMITPPINVGMAVELVSGAANFTVQYTYDDPNRLTAGVLFPLPFNSIISTLAVTTDGTLSTPFVATRLLINSGTGVLRARFIQAGIG